VDWKVGGGGGVHCRWTGKWAGYGGEGRKDNIVDSVDCMCNGQ
jgi:hypothetical protein